MACPWSSSPPGRCGGWTSSGRWSARTVSGSSPTVASSSTWRRAPCGSCAASGARSGLALAAAIYAGVPGASIAIETVTGIRRDPTYDDSLHPAPPGSPSGPLEELWTDPAVEGAGPARRHGPGAVPGGGDRRRRRSRVPTWTLDGLMEISAPGVTKGSALVGLAEELGVEAADVIAFGDMPNDLPMLTWAGTSYAMANAHPDVRSAADHVAPRTTRTASRWSWSGSSGSDDRPEPPACVRASEPETLRVAISIDTDLVGHWEVPHAPRDGAGTRRARLRPVHRRRRPRRATARFPRWRRPAGRHVRLQRHRQQGDQRRRPDDVRRDRRPAYQGRVDEEVMVIAPRTKGDCGLDRHRARRQRDVRRPATAAATASGPGASRAPGP